MFFFFAGSVITVTAQQGKKMEFRPVDFDVNEIAPDAPEGEWMASVPRGKIKIQATKEDHYPMMIIPLRLDSTEEDSEQYQKALGTELSHMIVFFGDEKARAARMSKLRLRELCEAAEVDLELVPTAVRSRGRLRRHSSRHSRARSSQSGPSTSARTRAR